MIAVEGDFEVGLCGDFDGGRETEVRERERMEMVRQMGSEGETGWAVNHRVNTASAPNDSPKGIIN